METTTCFRITIVIILVIRIVMTISPVISTTVTTTDIIIRQTTTRDREDNHQTETTIFRMIATDLSEGRTEIVIEIITTILQTPEIIMMGGRIRTQISQARTTSVERRITTFLEIVISIGF